MSEHVTDADRSLSLRLRVTLMEAETPEVADEAEEAIAAALAAEREKARAPFLALAAEFDENPKFEGRLSDAIRRAAEEGQQ